MVLGCYWGTETFFKNDFGSKIFTNRTKIIPGQVGFMGGATVNPLYKDVKKGNTKHVEVYDFTFEGDEDTFEDLVKHFFMFHDPTYADRQINDIGPQYASAIFVYDHKQRQIAEKVIGELQALLDAGKITGYNGKKVMTVVRDASQFYSAHEEHQAYLDKNPDGECNHYYRFREWPTL